MSYVSPEFQLMQKSRLSCCIKIANAVSFLILVRLMREAALLIIYSRLSKHISGRGGGGALTSNPCTPAIVRCTNFFTLRRV